MVATIISSPGKAKFAFSRTLAVVLLLTAAILLAPQDAEARRYASLVLDYETGTVVHAENPDREVYPASLTKMMTLYMLFEALQRGDMTMSTPLPVSQRAAGQPPSKLGLPAGSTIAVEDAILALAVKSANDVATVVAEALGGTEWDFSRDMTARARLLGMTSTDFRNASGLPDRNQVTTARDMAALSIAMIRDFPQHYHYFSVEQFSYNGRAYASHNNLLDDYQGADGIKTGYIRASGFNLAASVERNGRRLIAVVFGGRTARSRDQHMAKLLDEAFPRAYALAPIEPLTPGERNPFRSTQYAAAAPTTDADPHSGRLEIDYAGAPTTAGTSNSENFEGVLDSLSIVSSAAAAEAEPSVVAGDYSIQVGAFADQEPAEAMALKAAEEVADLVPSDRVATPQLPAEDGPLYRARLINLEEGLARRACQQLKASAIDCLVIRNGG